MQKETDDRNKTLNPAPSSPGSAEVIPNANPRANENIRIRSAEPSSDKPAPNKNWEEGSEITDGEDG